MLKKLVRKLYRNKKYLIIVLLTLLIILIKFKFDFLNKFSIQNENLRDYNNLQDFSKTKLNTFNENLRVLNNLQDFSDSKLNTFNETVKNFQEQLENDFNKYCDSKGEWINLNNEHFFKNGASFYIIDESKARLYFLTRSAFVFGLELKLVIKIENNGELELTVQGMSGTPWFVDVYASCTFDAVFDLNNILYSKKNLNLVQNLDKIKVIFYIRDKFKNTITKNPMELKLKYLNREKKKSAILCAKCLYLNAEEYLHLNWWIELNKRAGYEKIVMCNQSLGYNHRNIYPLGFFEIIESYGDFIELTQLECLPNFNAPVTETTKYFNTFKMMKISGEFNAFMTDTINILVLGQCYLDNIDKYDYVGVFDNDETVLPKISEHFQRVKDSVNLIKSFKKENLKKFTDIIFKDKCDSFSLQSQNINKTSNHIYSYLKNIEKSQNIDGTSLYFRQGYFISLQMVGHIIGHISDFFKKNKFNGSQIFINISHNDSLLSEFLNNSCNIIILNQDEYEYALGLINIFNVIIKPYIEKNKKIIDTYSDRYQRIFVILKNQDTLGKTIHNTKSTFEFTLHNPLLYLSNRPSFYSFIENEYGYLNHFRKTLSNIETISIRDLFLDLNFFNCFFLPIIKSFKN